MVNELGRLTALVNQIDQRVGRIENSLAHQRTVGQQHQPMDRDQFPLYKTVADLDINLPDIVSNNILFSFYIPNGDAL